MRIVIEEGHLILIGEGGLEIARETPEPESELGQHMTAILAWAATRKTPEEERLDELIAAMIEARGPDVEAYIDAWKPDAKGYKPGNFLTYEGSIYRVKLPHDASPDKPPNTAYNHYARVVKPDEQPPEWVKPQGTMGYYSTGDRVTYGGSLYISRIDWNDSEPGTNEDWSEDFAR